MPKESIYFQKWYAEQYDKDRFGGEFGRYLHSLEVETFLSMIEGFYGSVLDVGTGSGKLSLPLMRKSRQVVSIDSSLEMTRIASKKAEKEHLTLKAAICDAHDLCFRDDVFECVISSRVLMHLDDWKKGLSELCRVAQVLVVVDFPPLQGFSGLDSIIKKFTALLVPTVRPYKAFIIKNVMRELEKNNFRVVTVKKHFFLPIAFHRCLNRPRLSQRIEQLFSTIGLARCLGAPATIKAISNSYVEHPR